MSLKKIQQKSFAQELIINFSKKKKIIPSKFHYDLKGSKYFEKITKTKEYYVTRVEKEILNKISSQINKFFGNTVIQKIKFTTFEEDRKQVIKDKIEKKAVTRKTFHKKIESVRNEKIKKSLIELTKVFREK